MRQAQVARFKTLTAVERLRTRVVDVLDRQRVATRGGVVVRKDRVVVETTRVVTEHQHLGAVAVGRVRSAATDVGGVVHIRLGKGLRVLVATSAILLGRTTSCIRALDHEPELTLTTVALIPVHSVIRVEGRDEVLQVHVAAEELDAVIARGVGLDVLERRTGANTTKGKTLDLVAVRLTDVDTRVADGDVAHDARGVVVVRTAILGARVTARKDLVHAFDLFPVARSVAGVVRDGRAQEDDAAPQTTIFVRQEVSRRDVVLHRGEDDGGRSRAFSIDLAAAGYHEGRSVNALAILGLDHRSGFDVQLSTVLDDDQAAKDIYIIVRPMHRITGVDVGIGNRDGGTAFYIVGLGQRGAGRESDHDQHGEEGS